MRYKRNKKRYGGTRTIKMKFQSFMDINTSADSMQIITISAGGPEVIKRLAPQFSAYKYYRLGAVSAKLVPASTLPVDPTGLSYEVGDNPTVDPRDQLTPGLMRITNGEDIFEDISGLSDDQQHAIYNNMLLDPRWFKWMLQSGVKRYATPRYWQIGQLHQDKWPGSVINMPHLSALNAFDRTAALTLADRSGTTEIDEISKYINGSSAYGLFQTGHSGKLGWMPTDGLTRPIWNGEAWVKNPLLASPPEVEVMKIILPKAYKTEYYYRLFITETVYFREPIVNFGIAVSGLEYRPLDVFHTPGWPAPMNPGTGTISADWPNDSSTGGNYGDD